MLSSLRSQRSFLAQCLLALAMLAMGMQASLPKGYMFERHAESGTISVVFCNAGRGAEERSLNLATGEYETTAPDTDGTAANNGCALAAATALALDVRVDLLPTAPALRVEREHRRETREAIRAGDRPAPPARAPPRSV